MDLGTHGALPSFFCISKPMKGGDSMSGYAGKIGNKGSQQVNAPFKQGTPKKGSVHKGDDLRK